MSGSRESEELIQNLLSQGYNYHDALDKASLQFVAPPPTSPSYALRFLFFCLLLSMGSLCLLPLLHVSL